jgi:hypothetical protein
LLHDRQRAPRAAIGDERVVDATHGRLEALPEAMTIRRRTVEHPFGTLKDRSGLPLGKPKKAGRR